MRGGNLKKKGWRGVGGERFLFLLLGNPLHMGLRNAFMYSHLTILLYS